MMSCMNSQRTSLRCVWSVHAECRITAGHWPISDHFSKMANQNLSMVYSLCTHVHMANQIHEELEKWPTISNFLFCMCAGGCMCKCMCGRVSVLVCACSVCECDCVYVCMCVCVSEL